MNTEPDEKLSASVREPNTQTAAPNIHGANSGTDDIASRLSAPAAQTTASSNFVTTDAGASGQPATGVSSWAKNLKIPQPFGGGQDELNSTKSTFARFTSGIGLRLSPKGQATEQESDGLPSPQSNFFGNLTKGIVDSSKSAVKAVTDRARHVVSQNKRRFLEDGFDLDMTYITENIIAMGFPAGDLSSGLLGYVEGAYRNHMEEVVRFFEMRHKDKYKVYNLCSERLYDASLFEGKVASFPFDDHNCPPTRLMTAFCQSAYSWLKEDIENVVVVHCKAGMARTGLMISCLLLYLKFFPTAEESIDFYNQKRCIDGKALVLPSQIRYVKYFERVLTYFNGENQPGRRCMLRGFRLHRCPYWIRPHITISDHNGVLFSSKKHPRTKDLSPEDFWFSPPKKGVLVFALPGEPGLTELCGDFKVHFHDRQGDFYFWLNTTMTENRKTLNTSDIDWFDKRKLPSPGFQVEVVLVDLDSIPSASPPPPHPEAATAPIPQAADKSPSSNASSLVSQSSLPPNPDQSSDNREKDDVFSDNEAAEEGSGSKKGGKPEQSTSFTRDNKPAESPVPGKKTSTSSDQVDSVTQMTGLISIGKGSSTTPSLVSEPKNEAPGMSGSSEFKAMAADASVFTFGDEDDFESD